MATLYTGDLARVDECPLSDGSVAYRVVVRAPEGGKNLLISAYSRENAEDIYEAIEAASCIEFE